MNRFSDTLVVFGAPIFGNDPRLCFAAPLGQQHLHQAVRAETADFREIGHRLAQEYGAILAALADMELPTLRVAWAQEELMQPGVRTGLDAVPQIFVRLPETDPRCVTSPRDLAVTLPDGTVLLDADLADIPLPTGQGAPRVLRSPLGQGGRLLSRGRIALVPEWVMPEPTFQIHLPDIEPLTQAGLTAGILPNTVNFEIDGHLRGFVPDDHLDRIAGRLEDPNGQLHLVVPPGFAAGPTNPDFAPRWTGSQALNRYRDVCQGLGIRVHVPTPLTVPGATGFWQAPDSRVLLTGGDDAVAEVVAGIVGSDHVVRTAIPIRYYPVWSKATIHCLIGELPAFLCTPVS